MAHTIRDKDKLLARIRRLRGQMDGIERALVAEVPCAEILRQLASIRGAISGLTAEVMVGHLTGHVMDAENDEDRSQAADEMIEVIRSYMK